MIEQLSVFVTHQPNNPKNENSGHKQVPTAQIYNVITNLNNHVGCMYDKKCHYKRKRKKENTTNKQTT